jgi:hypothetical protein
MIEFIVAMMLFGIAIGGLFPLIIMYSRVVESLEQRPKELALHRSDSQDSFAYRDSNPNEWHQMAIVGEPNLNEWVHRWYLVPFSDDASAGSDAWTRKCGAGASIQYTDPGVVHVPLSEPTNAEVVAYDAVGGATTNYAEFPIANWIEEPVANATNALNANQRRSPLNAAGTATWTFTVAQAGWYQISATGLITGAPTPVGCSYTLTYGVTSVPIAIPPTLTFGASHDWSVLATKYLPAGALTIQLMADASNVAIADGMSIVRCSSQVKSWNSDAHGNPTATVEIKPAIVPP